MTTDNWRDHAACLGTDPDLFFPVGSTGPAWDQAQEVKQLCAGCEVRDDCLDWALATHQPAGIWGGNTEDERRSLRRARQRARRAG